MYLNNTLGITQFYGVAGNSNGVLYGGSQDNGVTKYTGSANGWVFANGGDGGKAAVDPTDPTYLYNEYTYGKVNRSTGSGGKAEGVAVGPPDWNAGTGISKFWPTVTTLAFVRLLSVRTSWIPAP